MPKRQREATIDEAAEFVAQRFHELYEELASEHGYTPRKETSVPWDEVPEPNRSLMLAVAKHLLDEGSISTDVRIVEDEELPR